MPKNFEDATSPPATVSEDQFARGFALAAQDAPHNYPEAMKWYQLAADQDHRLAQFNLGQMFARGQGVPKSDSMALMWIHRAAEGGDAGAQFDLGCRYARACVHGTEMDVVESRIEAYKWFTLSAVQFYGAAQNRADSSTMHMSREEVSEGNCRVKNFTVPRSINP